AWFEMSASYARRHAELACSGYAVGLAIVIVRAGSFETEVSQDDAQGEICRKWSDCRQGCGHPSLRALFYTDLDEAYRSECGPADGSVIFFQSIRCRKAI